MLRAWRPVGVAGWDTSIQEKRMSSHAGKRGMENKTGGDALPSLPSKEWRTAVGNNGNYIHWHEARYMFTQCWPCTPKCLQASLCSNEVGAIITSMCLSDGEIEYNDLPVVTAVVKCHESQTQAVSLQSPTLSFYANQTKPVQWYLSCGASVRDSCGVGRVPGCGESTAKGNRDTNIFK